MHRQKLNQQALQELKREFQDMSLPYEVIEFLSRGSYGAVCSGANADTGVAVAIKRVFTTTSESQIIHILRSEFLCKRVLREVCLLAHFQHPNLLGLLDLVLDRTSNNEKLYLITELMKTDLQQVIADRKIDLSLEHIRYFSLRATRHLPLGSQELQR